MHTHRQTIHHQGSINRSVEGPQLKGGIARTLAAKESLGAGEMERSAWLSFHMLLVALAKALVLHVAAASDG